MTRICVAALALVSLAGAAGAQPKLADPTRPPNVTAVPGGEGVAEAPPPAQLQSVLISRGRKIALINGAAVPLGGRVGEATLVKISETEVTLRRGDELEVLKLHAGVEKMPTRSKGIAAKTVPRKPAAEKEGTK